MDVQLLNKMYNEILNRLHLDPDKYEREDAYMSILMDIEDGVDPMYAFVTTFESVHEKELTPAMYNSVYAACKGMDTRWIGKS